MLDIKKIERVLTMAPLCQRMWIVGAGDEAKYCSQGALLRAAGTSQEQIAAWQRILLPSMLEEGLTRAERDDRLWKRMEARDAINKILLDEYGLDDEITEEIPQLNDAAPNTETRALEVLIGIKMIAGILSEDEGEREYEKLTKGLITGDTSAMLSHDNDEQAAPEEASQGSGLSGNPDDAAATPDDADGPGRSGQGDPAHDWTMGGGPDGPAAQPAAVRPHPALAAVG